MKNSIRCGQHRICRSDEPFFEFITSTARMLACINATLSMVSVMFTLNSVCMCNVSVIGYLSLSLSCFLIALEMILANGSVTQQTHVIADLLLGGE
jgi:hypothetical protein